MKRAFFVACAVCSVMCCLPSPARASADAVAVVRVAPIPPPPPPRAVIVAPAPRPGFVWVAGFYQWSGRAYVWVPGGWVRPPYPRAVWVPSRVTYVPAQRGYVVVGGYWHR